MTKGVAKETIFPKSTSYQSFHPIQQAEKDNCLRNGKK